jgi:hypothetical protein
LRARPVHEVSCLPLFLSRSSIHRAWQMFAETRIRSKIKNQRSSIHNSPLRPSVTFADKTPPTFARAPSRTRLVFHRGRIHPRAKRQSSAEEMWDPYSLHKTHRHAQQRLTTTRVRNAQNKNQNFPAICAILHFQSHPPHNKSVPGPKALLPRITYPLRKQRVPLNECPLQLNEEL